MSVILNESGIAAYMESPTVVAFVERSAQKIVEAMQEDIRSYFVDAETSVEDDVGLRMEGSRAVVGLQNDPSGRHTSPGESKSERYARVGQWKITRETAGEQ